MNERRSLRSKLKTALVYAVLGSMITAQTQAYAAQAELADVPLASSSTAAVKPNILFVLDDSGSMDWEYMPDRWATGAARPATSSHVCNSIYYNPAVTYAPPKNADGTELPRPVPSLPRRTTASTVPHRHVTSAPGHRPRRHYQFRQ